MKSFQFFTKIELNTGRGCVGPMARHVLSKNCPLYNKKVLRILQSFCEYNFTYASKENAEMMQN